MSESRFNGPLARIVRSVFSAHQPDPWPAEVDLEVKSSRAVPLCTRCLAPQPPHHWFCHRCGGATGDLVATMPYLQIFVIAEVLRRGVTGPPERRIGVQLFLVLFALTQYALFAPIYWFWMVRRAAGRPICQEPVFPEEEEKNA